MRTALGVGGGCGGRRTLRHCVCLYGCTDGGRGGISGGIADAVVGGGSWYVALACLSERRLLLRGALLLSRMPAAFAARHLFSSISGGGAFFASCAANSFLATSC